MKTAYAIALFTASTQAISMETMAAYAQGDSAADGYDPDNVQQWIGREGRDDRVTPDHETGLEENVLVYDPTDVPASEKTKEERTDAETRPMCSIGGILDTEDIVGPSDPCCRVYEKDNFKGLHYDFCHYGPTLDMTDRYYQADQFGWHNEINSYKCGKDVNIRLCTHIKNGSTYAKNECNPGNPNVHEGKTANRLPQDTFGAETVNKHDSIWIFKCDNCAMVYEDENCIGDNFIVRPDINHLNSNRLPDYASNVNFAKEKGSWDFYDHTFHPILAERRSKSVMLPLEMEFEFFEGDRVFKPSEKLARSKLRDFTGQRSYTIRNLGKKTNAAAPLSSCYNFAQMMSWMDETNVDTIDWNDLKPANKRALLVKDQVSGVSGIKIREQWMPEV